MSKQNGEIFTVTPEKKTVVNKPVNVAPYKVFVKGDKYMRVKMRRGYLTLKYLRMVAKRAGFKEFGVANITRYGLVSGNIPGSVISSGKHVPPKYESILVYQVK